MGDRFGNVPQCERCWVDQHTNPDGTVRVPVRLAGVGADPETCHWCGHPTWAGIWVRTAL